MFERFRRYERDVNKMSYSDAMHVSFARRIGMRPTYPLKPGCKPWVNLDIVHEWIFAIILILGWLVYMLFIGWFKHFFCATSWSGTVSEFYAERDYPHQLREAVLGKNNLDDPVSIIARSNFITINETLKVASPKYSATYCGWAGEVKNVKQED